MPVKIKILRVLKILWFILCVALVIWTFQMGGEARLIAFYILGIVALPSSIILHIVASVIGSQISFDGILPDSVFDFAFCIFAICAGYFQWFVLLPRLYNRIKNEKSLIIWIFFLASFAAVFYGCYRFYQFAFPLG